MQSLETTIRGWIGEIIRAHSSLLGIAVRQRAKFEGWLKLELAAHAEAHGASDVKVESGYEHAIGTRCDLTFNYGGRRCDIELKTCNTNWRIQGILPLTRPITQNVRAIVKDARKLENCPGEGIVAFCIFPLLRGDQRWEEYLARISSELGLALSATEHTDRVTICLDGDHEADVAVVVFSVQKHEKSPSPPKNLSAHSVRRRPLQA
jgi:hypothetical protein